MMARIFISYAWRDGAAVARWLYERFNRAEGWSAWMDLDLHADTIFSYELQKRINEADYVVVVVSSDVNRQDTPSFVQRELGYATQPQINKPVFAVRAEECAIPLIIWGVTYVDFLAADTYETGFADLLAKIEAGPVKRRESPRERELDYLRELARNEALSRAAKFYLELPAEARQPIKPDTPLVEDAEAAAFLAEMAMAIYTDKRHAADDDTAKQKVETFAELSAALAQFDRVAIIGDPGSGKTTTLRRFAYMLGEQAAQDENAPLPLYVPLGGYDGGDFERYMEGFFGGLKLREHLPQRAVLLLDGLNETAFEYVATIQNWLKQNPNVRVMLTCRKLDYVERKLDLQRVDVLPLDAVRIRQLMLAYRLPESAADKLFWSLAGEILSGLWEKWQRKRLNFEAFWAAEREIKYDHPVYTLSSPEEKIAYDKLRQKLYERNEYPGLIGLARNPFLLTIMIAIFVRSGDVPRNRAQLFEGFIRQMFAERGEPASRKRPPWIDEAVQRNGLAKLAHQMQQTRTLVDYDWAREVIAKTASGFDPDHLLYLAASAGLIEIGQEVRFSHQLLQEYFAAWEMGEDMRRGVPAARYWPDAEWWKPSGWEETAIFLAGLGDDATDVVKWLTPVNPIVAYRCVQESGVACSEESLQGLYEPSEGARISPLARAAWGRILAERGDTRRGVGVIFIRRNGGTEQGGLIVPDIDWVKIPAGAFLMGSDRDVDILAYHNETPQHTVVLGEYYISRYIVTYRQFQAFLDAIDGYSYDKWWDKVPEKYRKRQIEDQNVKYDNYPRENVSWYQAMAFSRWLTAKYVEVCFNPLSGSDNFVVRLPTETEWEKAARGTNGLIYPYGNVYDPTKANTLDTGIGKPSPVGIFVDGASPYGVMDMSGNVCEWCLTNWRSTYYQPEYNGLSNENSRVFRGGSFVSGLNDTRSACRDRGLPNRTGFGVGFRIVCAPLLPDDKELVAIHNSSG